MSHRIALLDKAAHDAFAPVLAVHAATPMSDVDGASAAVVCGEKPGAVRDALRAGVPLLAGMDAIRASLADLDGADRWLPWLPLPESSDAEGARAALAGGAIGAVEDIAITSYHGRPERPQWTDDEVRSVTWFEAAVWALDLAEQLAGSTVTETEWLRRPEHAVHRIGPALATVRCLPSELGPGPAYSATVTGQRGQLLLRMPFAPGGVAIWRAATREFVVPALAKPDRTAGTGVSTPGGWEAHAALRRLAGLAQRAPGYGDKERARAVRIVRHLHRHAGTGES